MSRSRTRPAPGAADALFDRYTLPKVALTVILAASLLGTWVTASINGDGTLFPVLARWGYFVALGVLTGGLVWKHAFVRPADLGTDAAEYCDEMYARFDRIAAVAVAVVLLGGAVVLRDYLATLGRTPAVFGFGVLLIAWITVVAWTTRSDRPVGGQFRSLPGLAALGLALAVVGATAVAEVALRGFDPVAAGVRVLHLLAFALWIGGAVWNIFVAVPTGQRRPTVAVVRAAGEQLERFRRVVRFVIPTLFATGIYQAVDGFGSALGGYVGSVLGLAVLSKVGCIGLLVVIFKLCPMWRACSPVEGVCDLEGLGGERGDEDDGSEGDPATDSPGVTGDD